MAKSLWDTVSAATQAGVSTHQRVYDILNPAPRPSLFDGLDPGETIVPPSAPAPIERPVAVTQQPAVAPAYKKVDDGVDPITFTAAHLGKAILGTAKGAVGLVAPDSAAYRGLDESIASVDDLLGADYKADRRAKQAEVDAQDSNTGKALVALRQAATDPGSIIQGIGYVAPAALLGAAGSVVGLGARGLAALQTAYGAIQGGGAVRGGVYDNVMNAKPEQLATSATYNKYVVAYGETRAREMLAKDAAALENSGDMVALGALVGAVMGRTGLEASLTKAAVGAGVKATAKTVGKKVAVETVTEPGQEGFESYAGNVGARRTGADIKLDEGVAQAMGAAAPMGAVGGSIGARIEHVQAAMRKQADANSPDPVTAPGEPTPAQATALQDYRDALAGKTLPPEGVTQNEIIEQSLEALLDQYTDPAEGEAAAAQALGERDVSGDSTAPQAAGTAVSEADTAGADTSATGAAAAPAAATGITATDLVAAVNGYPPAPSVRPAGADGGVGGVSEQGVTNGTDGVDTQQQPQPAADAGVRGPAGEAQAVGDGGSRGASAREPGTAARQVGQLTLQERIEYERGKNQYQALKGVVGVDPVAEVAAAVAYQGTAADVDAANDAVIQNFLDREASAEAQARADHDTAVAQVEAEQRAQVEQQLANAEDAQQLANAEDAQRAQATADARRALDRATRQRRISDAIQDAIDAGMVYSDSVTDKLNNALTRIGDKPLSPFERTMIGRHLMMVEAFTEMMTTSDAVPTTSNAETTQFITENIKERRDGSAAPRAPAGAAPTAGKANADGRGAKPRSRKDTAGDTGAAPSVSIRTQAAPAQIVAAPQPAPIRSEALEGTPDTVVPDAADTATVPSVDITAGVPVQQATTQSAELQGVTQGIARRRLKRAYNAGALDAADEVRLQRMIDEGDTAQASAEMNRLARENLGGDARFLTTAKPTVRTTKDFSGSPDSDALKELERVLAKSFGTAVAPGSALAAAPMKVSGQMKRLADALGVRVVMFQPKAGADAKFAGFNGVTVGGPLRNTIFINVASDRPHVQVLGHELVHEMARDFPDLYDALLDQMRPYVSEAQFQAFQTSPAAVGETNVDRILQEFAGEVMSDALTTPAFWAGLADANPSLFGRLWERLTALIDRITSRLPATEVMQGYTSDYQAIVAVAAKAMSDYRSARVEARALSGTDIRMQSQGVPREDNVNSPNITFLNRPVAANAPPLPTNVRYRQTATDKVIAAVADNADVMMRSLDATALRRDGGVDGPMVKLKLAFESAFYRARNQKQVFTEQLDKDIYAPLVKMVQLAADKAGAPVDEVMKFANNIAVARRVVEDSTAIFNDKLERESAYKEQEALIHAVTIHGNPQLKDTDLHDLNAVASALASAKSSGKFLSVADTNRLQANLLSAIAQIEAKLVGLRGLQGIDIPLALRRQAITDLHLQQGEAAGFARNKLQAIASDLAAMFDPEVPRADRRTAATSRLLQVQNDIAQWNRAQARTDHLTGTDVRLPAGMTIREANDLIAEAALQPYAADVTTIADKVRDSFAHINDFAVAKGVTSAASVQAALTRRPNYVSFASNPNADADSFMTHNHRAYMDIAEGSTSYMHGGNLNVFQTLNAKMLQAAHMASVHERNALALELARAGMPGLKYGVSPSTPRDSRLQVLDEHGRRVFIGLDRENYTQQAFIAARNEISDIAYTMARVTGGFGGLFTHWTLAFPMVTSIKDVMTRAVASMGRDFQRTAGIDMGSAETFVRISAMMVRNMASVDTARAALDHAAHRPLTGDLAGLQQHGGILTFSKGTSVRIKQLEDRFVKTGMLRATASMAASAVSAWNEYWQAGPSIAMYKTLRSLGATQEQAAAATLSQADFHRSGNTRIPRMIYTFFNPAAQDALVTARMLKDSRGNWNYGAMGVLVGVATVSAFLYALARARDAEDPVLKNGRKKMDNLPTMAVTTSMHVPLPSGGYAKLPIGFGMFGSAFALGVIQQRYADGLLSAKEAAMEGVRALLKPAFVTGEPMADISKEPLFAMAQIVTPDILQPMLNVLANKSSFGSQLAYGTRSDVAKAAQGSDRLPEIYKEAAKGLHKAAGLDVAPEKLQELARGYFAGPLRLVTDYITEQNEAEKGLTPTQNVPWWSKALGAGRVYSDPSAVADLHTAFYRDYDRARGTFVEYNSKIHGTNKAMLDGLSPAGKARWLVTKADMPESEVPAVSAALLFDDQKKRLDETMKYKAKAGRARDEWAFVGQKEAMKDNLMEVFLRSVHKVDEQ